MGGFVNQQKKIWPNRIGEQQRFNSVHCSYTQRVYEDEEFKAKIRTLISLDTSAFGIYKTHFNRENPAQSSLGCT